MFFMFKKNFCLQIVREHYLRKDIWCGAKDCEKCALEEKDMVLDACPISKCSLISDPHYIFLDTNAVLDQVNYLCIY